MYKNYLFDLYGTLVDIHTDEGKKSLWHSFKNLLAMYGAKYKTKELQSKYNELCEKAKKAVPATKYTNEPELELIDVFKGLVTEKGAECSDELAAFLAASFRAMSLKYIKLYDGALDLLRSLKEAGGKVYLLSNAQSSFTKPELKLLGIYDEFDGIVISSDEGCKKPDVKFYQTILKRYKLKKSETIMIGNDYITDIKGSHDAGLASLYLHTNISPEIEGELLADYKVMDGSLKKAKKLLLK
ncbi:HAD family hydrolase [Pseudoruminococcus massiliensis]|uniref:HAD family hydrolase n=1 Tax=Pseudoruminococcus massiliensis TaxID=2086583 RepID=UPI000D0F41D7|nr:HAD family hydrolase [Pseudoruminococcus massiliensis]